MSTKRARIVLSSAFFIVTAYACIPQLNFPDTSGCIRICNEENIECLDVKNECPIADACFKSLEQCFQETNECSKACNDCETKGTCTSSEKCRQACSDKGTSCTDMINICVDETVRCFEGQVDKKEDCFNAKDGFVNCVADCVEEIEDEINKL